jgi:hypothetical protein
MEIEEAIAREPPAREEVKKLSIEEEQATSPDSINEPEK